MPHLPAEYTLLPLLGVNHHITPGWCTLHQTFGGIGLVDLPIEQVICHINYGTPSSLGCKLSVSLHCWAKFFWETLSKYDVGPDMTNGKSNMQCKGDCTVLDFLLPYMTTTDMMTSINHCRCYLNVLFLLDMTSLDGSSVNNDMVWGSCTPFRS